METSASEAQIRNRDCPDREWQSSSPSRCLTSARKRGRVGHIRKGDTKTDRKGSKGSKAGATEVGQLQESGNGDDEGTSEDSPHATVTLCSSGQVLAGMHGARSHCNPQGSEPLRASGTIRERAAGEEELQGSRCRTLLLWSRDDYTIST